MTQSGPVTIDSPAPLDDGTLVLRSMRATEGLSQCFEYVVTLGSATDLDPDDLLGVGTCVHLETTSGTPRHFHGVITSLDYLGPAEADNYRMTLRPWLWLLGLRVNSRIFQNKKVPDILTAVFADSGFADYDTSRLTPENYTPQEYVVQYHESDLHFVSRLMEREGIYYYFRHEASRHVLVLVDANTAHDAPPSAGDAGTLELPFRPPDAHRDALTEYVDRWRRANAVEPGVYTHADFDFTKSRAKLYGSRSNTPGYENDGLEIYEYPGRFNQSSAGDAYALIRLQQQQVGLSLVSGSTNARALAGGYLFSLIDCPRDDQNGDYLVISASYRLTGQATETRGGSSGGATFGCVFTAIDASRQYRPPVTLSKPVVTGPQTAIVVGPDGEEIWTDKFGRVKIQFHWDREGKSDENSSCFARVSQVWAGSGFGAMHIPRIGQEVIVDFLEGDPNRPIITGRVYNDANMPPYALPSDQTRSGIKSRSTKGGNASNANEIRFEDRKGSEEFFVQAEKDLNATIKANESVSVGAARSVTVGSDDSLKVGANRKVNVQANESLSVGANRDVQVSGNETSSIGGNQSLSVTGSRSVNVTGSESATILGGQSLTSPSQTSTLGLRTTTVAGADTLTVGAARTETVGGALAVTVGGNSTTSIGGKDGIAVGGDQTITVTGAAHIKIGSKYMIEVGDEVVIKSGSASVTLKSGGDVVVKGGKVTVQASGDLVLKGSKVGIN